MNTSQNVSKTSDSNHSISFPSIASALSVVLLSGCVNTPDKHSDFLPSYHDEPVVPSDCTPLPYRPLSELGKNPLHSSDIEELEKWEQLRNFMTRSIVPSEEEFVDDDGNIFTREDLESGNQ